MTVSEYEKAKEIMQNIETSDLSINKFNRFVRLIPDNAGIKIELKCGDSIDVGYVCIQNCYCKDFLTSLGQLLQKQYDDNKQELMDL